MDRFELDDVVRPVSSKISQSPLKDWRIKYQAGTIHKSDFIEFFKRKSRTYFEFQYETETDPSKPSLKCTFREDGAKEGIIDELLAFMLGDNPDMILDKLQQEGNTATVCGKVFKNGEPTYSCRECGMDPTCVLCVNCFKQSAHRFHKYRMSTSGGGGCCDCGDEEAWKKDHYCEEHLRGKENPPASTIITDVMKERCELACVAILSFCVTYFEIESNASLECLDGDDDDESYFCTVLYNDESHTFDQVIQTITKIVKCRQKDATEIVSSIDREGRAVVKCDTFFECVQLKEAIEKQSVNVNVMLPPTRSNQSLRVSVLHISKVSCQQFALQLLTWFQEFLIRHRVFRQIFARVIMEKRPHNAAVQYHIRHILEYDVKLWKMARTCWHRLLISGMLMEYDNKMALAQQFSRHYASIMQDFIRDDHDHSFSIVSLSVQLFTVPSIAHYLIANESIFYKLLHTFYNESVEKYIQNKTLHFAKNTTNLGFKRSAYILYDLRYILSFKPDVWTDDLRDGFLEGCKSLLRLLNVMHGMEAVTRQTGQHMDYEPEWECAFNLHIKLACTITLVLEWCATDRLVLTKLYQMVMRYIMNNNFILSSIKTEEKTVAGHVANCMVYDVASQPVSIHLPLSRFFAGIYLHLEAHGLTFDNVVSTAKRTPEELMEPILCTQTMIAQVHAGMWRRNGYSLLHQLYFYRNVRCRGEMLDRDIVGMQIGATLIESNQYLIHVLNKFGLLDWIQPDYEEKLTISSTDDDFIRQLSMIDEFLELLIVIIGERYVPGIANVTEEDRTKKEIIQLLCMKSFSHSELNRALPDSNNDTVLEDVIESVAVFKKPQKSDSKGVYELREELYDDYNMFFYHYTKEDKSKSEETQCQRRKNKGELVCCPPPKLAKLTNSFISIANLLQCDVMMNIISTILDRALDLKAKTFLENHLQKVLYLIGYGLQEEESENYPFLSFCAAAQKHDLLAKLEKLSHSARVEAHRDFVLWTLKKFKEVQLKSAPTDAAMQGDDAENVEDAENNAQAPPLTAAEQEKQEKEERARLAAERRAKIMAQMQSAQNNFIKSNAEMFASTNAVAQSSDVAAKTTSMEWQDDNSAEGKHEEQEEGAVAYQSLACLGVDRRLQQPEEQSFKCILCFEDCTVSKNGATLVYSAFIQKSKVLPPAVKYPSSVHTNSCGHVMHMSCWQAYYNNEESKEKRRPHRNRHMPIPSMPNTEFQCPYCRCLSNTVLPLTAPLSKYSTPNVIHNGDEVFPLDQWIEVMKTFGDELNKSRVKSSDGDDPVFNCPTWETILKNSNLVVDVNQFAKIAQPIEQPELPESWCNFVQHYIKSVRQYAPTAFDDNEKEGLLWMWHSCIYTLQALEVYLRAIDRPFKNQMSIRHQSCLSGLIRASCLHAANLSSDDVTNLVGPVTELLDTVFKHKGTSVLEWNCFSMLVATIFMVPNMLFSMTPNKRIVPNGSMMDFYTLQLFFLANIVKAIVLFKAPTIDGDYMDIDDDYDQEVKNISPKIQENIADFYRKYNIPARHHQRQQHQRPQRGEGEEMGAQEERTNVDDLEGVVADDDDDVADDDNINADAALSKAAHLHPGNIECNLRTIATLFEHIKTEMREFLRCCCLFFHFVTDVDFLDEFETSDGDTFENMCNYLGLQSNLDVYFDSQSTYATILETFASHPDIVYGEWNKDEKTLRRKHNKVDQELTVMPCTHAVPKLIDLPDDYSDLINSVSDVICPNNEREEMKMPTMCLICGQLLCAQSYCCQPELNSQDVGACTYHANFCGAEIGMFLRIRDCQIVYLGRYKGCFVQPPYLDEYGETDQGLRRGNPLRLCRARYSKIHLTWLGHGLHEEIARLNDNAAVIGAQWYHM